MLENFVGRSYFGFASQSKLLNFMEPQVSCKCGEVTCDQNKDFYNQLFTLVCISLEGFDRIFTLYFC